MQQPVLFRFLPPIITSSWGSVTAGGPDNTIVFSQLKIAVLAPIARERVRTATAVNPGLPPIWRMPYLMSVQSGSMENLLGVTYL